MRQNAAAESVRLARQDALLRRIERVLETVLDMGDTFAHVFGVTDGKPETVKWESDEGKALHRVRRELQSRLVAFPSEVGPVPTTHWLADNDNWNKLGRAKLDKAQAELQGLLKKVVAP